MAKCERCGIGGIGLIRSGYKYSDGKYTCIPCALELGFKKDGIKNPCAYFRYEDVKNGLAAYYERKGADDINRRSARIGISPAQYYALEQAGATEFEFKVFARICALLDDEGVESQDLTISSGDNGSLLVMKDGTVLMEYKGEPDIKWIRLSDDPENKIRFAQVGKLNGLADRIVNIVANG